jgi:hypothetical protein
MDAFWDFVPVHGTKSQKASIIDTTMKASQNMVFFSHKYFAFI